MSTHEHAQSVDDGFTGDDHVDDAAVFRLIYRSHSRLPLAQRRTELGNIFSAARSTNKKRGVTGALLLTDDWFVQTLEGSEPVVRALFAHIRTDPRHEQVKVVQEGTVPERVFARWHMAKISADDEPDLPLIAGPKGATAAAAHESTQERDEVLDIMRAAARLLP